MKFKLATVVRVVGAILAANVALAGTFRAPVPGLLGTYETDWVIPDIRTAAFDVGAQFQSIGEVRIRLVGIHTPGEVSAPEGGPLPGWFQSELAPGGGVRIHPPVGPFDVVGPFAPGYDQLLDGQGSVDLLFWYDEVGIGGSVASTPTAVVAAAALEVDGVPVPGTVAGDCDGDDDVDVLDVIDVVAAFGGEPGMPNWNPGCDIDGDGDVDIHDVIDVITHFANGT